MGISKSGAHIDRRLGTLSPSLSLRRLQTALLIAAPVAFALLALAMGKKTGWDLYNYHWYNPYALLNDRFGFDVAVAHHATYYNPLADVPLYLLTTHSASWVGGIFMGVMAGITVALVGVLGFHVLPIDDARQRTWASALLATLGAFGAGAFQEIGDPANDIPAAIGILLALILIARQSAPRASESASSGMMILAGLLAGAAVALKLTIAVYAVGIAVALLFVHGSFAHRFTRTLLFSSGAVLGLLAVGGFWMWKLWQYSDNPFFPYFNGLFHSHLLANADYRDRNFAPQSWLRAVLFPFYFTAESRAVSESVFRDAHILILYVVLPLTLVVRFFFRRRTEPLVESSKLLFAFAAFSYLAWLAVFDIYRYLIPLEGLAPLITALAFAAWPMNGNLRWTTTIAVLVIAQLLVRIDISDRQTWRGPYVDVSVPNLPQPEHTMIVMTGHAPMAYVIPYFPKSIPFVRIDSWLVQASDTQTALALQMRDRVARHEGPIYVLFEGQELDAAQSALEHYQLRFAGAPSTNEACDQVRSNINIPLLLCKLQRVSAGSE